MAQVIQLALGVFIGSLGVEGRTKTWEAHERDKKFGENQSIDIRNSQRLHKEWNARNNLVSTMRPSCGKLIEKVWISRCCESPETDLLITANGCCVDYTDAWSPNGVDWLSKRPCANHWNNNSGCEDTVEFDTVVTWASLPITRILPRVCQTSEIQWSLFALHNTGWMDHRWVCNGSFKAITVLDPVHVEIA